MTIEKLLKLGILRSIKVEYDLTKIQNRIRDNLMFGVDSKLADCSIPHSDFPEWLKNNYNLEKLDDDYFPLLEEFLNEYALNKTEKSE